MLTVHCLAKKAAWKTNSLLKNNSQVSRGFTIRKKTTECENLKQGAAKKPIQIQDIILNMKQSLGFT